MDLIKTKHKRIDVVHIIYYVCLVLSSLLIIIPFVWLISTSFDKFDSYGLPFPPRLLPANPSFFNYKLALTSMPIIKYLMNTCIIAIISLVLNVIISTMSGYALSKGKYPGKKFLLLLILSNMMVPFEIKLVPMYNIVKAIGLSNNFLGVVLPAVMTNALFIFFIKQFCDDLPDDLKEAAYLDGAGKFKTYFSIYLPLMKPIIATIIVLDVINVWNDLLWPMIVINKTELSTIQLGLVRFTTSSTSQTHAGIATALSILSILPLAAVFTFLQKFIVQSIAATGIK